MAARVVHVEVHGQRYAVRSDLDPQYIAALADYLDARIRQASRELASNDPLRLAVIAALNVTDELFRTRATSTDIEERVRARTADIERLVDAVLDQARDRIVVNE
jgi:cell division protein ZapA (FtsZ GTPase activity inhibitor)